MPNRSTLAAGMIAAVFAALSCAQVLGYDDYRARDRTTPAPIDTGIADTGAPEPETAADTGEPPFRAPARPIGDAAPSGSGKTLWLAIKTYRLGSIDPAGLSDETAWSVQGYDLDNLCTTKAQSTTNTGGTCRRPDGAQQDSLTDGERCRDNNFGRYVGTILRSAAPDTEKTLNENITAGAATWLLRIDDVDDSPDDTYAPATLLRVSDERMSEVKMKWDGSDVRAVHSDTVIDGDINRGLTTFPGGFIKNGTWVSGEPASLELLVPVTATLFVTMKMDHALLSLELSADRTGGKNGIVAGVLAEADVEAVLKPIADNGGVCPGSPLYETLMSTAAKMPDVSIGIPGLQDTTSTCNGVSAGMGFDVLPIQPVTKVVAPPPPRNPRCADAG